MPPVRNTHCPQSTFLLVPQSLHTSNKDINTKRSGGYFNWGLPRSSRISRLILSSMSPVRKWQRPPSTLLLDPHSWHTYNKDINTKLLGYLPLGVPRLSMMSRMTISYMYLARNPQCPPSTTSLLDPQFPTYFQKIYQHKICGVSSIGSSKVIHDINSDPVYHVPVQVP